MSFSITRDWSVFQYIVSNRPRLDPGFCLTGKSSKRDNPEQLSDPNHNDYNRAGNAMKTRRSLFIFLFMAFLGACQMAPESANIPSETPGPTQNPTQSPSSESVDRPDLPSASPSEVVGPVSPGEPKPSEIVTRPEPSIEPPTSSLDYSGQDLGDHDFSEQDLQGADFTGANLKGANFTRANLRNAIFRSAKLDRVIFTEAYLQGADFAYTDLATARASRGVAADFSGYDLIATNFHRARLLDLRFDKTLLRGADFSQAMAHGVKFSKADLYRANFQEADLLRAVFIENNMLEADLSGADLEDTIFTRNTGMVTWVAGGLCNLDRGEIELCH